MLERKPQQQKISVSTTQHSFQSVDSYVEIGPWTPQIKIRNVNQYIYLSN